MMRNTNRLLLLLLILQTKDLPVPLISSSHFVLTLHKSTTLPSSSTDFVMTVMAVILATLKTLIIFIGTKAAVCVM